MSEPSTDRRAPETALKAVGTTSTAFGAVGILVGTADWLIKSQAAHHFIPPDNALVVLWATALAPLIHLMYRIIENRLKRAAGEFA